MIRARKWILRDLVMLLILLIAAPCVASGEVCNDRDRRGAAGGIGHHSDGALTSRIFSQEEQEAFPMPDGG